MNRARFTAAFIELGRSQCAVAGLREVATHRGDALYLRTLDELRNRLAVLEGLLQADRLEAIQAEPYEPALPAFAQPRLPLEVPA